MIRISYRRRLLIQHVFCLPPTRSCSSISPSDHEMFLRGLPHLCHLMRRPSSKEIKAMKSEPRALPVPDLHAISRDNPLPEAYGGFRVSSATGTQSSSSSGTTPPIVGTGGFLAPMQGQAPPGMGTLLQHMSAGTGTTAALASIMIQAAGPPAPPPPPPPPQAPLAAALPTGNVADLLLSLLNQQNSAPAQAPAAASIPAPSAALPPEQQLMATWLAQQQANNNNNNNGKPSVSASASGFTPVSGAVGGIDLSALLSQMQARPSSVPQAVSSNQAFMFNPNPTLACNNAAMLPQFSQQLGGVGGGNNSLTEAALLLTIRSLAATAPFAPPPPPPPPPQPSNFNIQELFRLLGNSNPGNSNNASNNNNHASDQGGGNQER